MRKIRDFFLEHFEIALIILIFLGIFSIAFLVHYKLAFLNFFFLPVILSGYFLGKRQAVLTGIFCVLLIVLYLIFTVLFGQREEISFDEIITLITWGSFLILTGAIIGSVSEQRESQIKNLRRAYIGVLEIMLKYLEMADEERPRSLRVTLLAEKIARELGLSKRDVENIKSAALLYEAGSLRDNLPLFSEVVSFMEEGVIVPESELSDRERVMLKTTASLLEEIEPMLTGYFRYYLEDADKMEKDVEEIPVGSAIIALADLYDRFSSGIPSPQTEGIRSFADIEKLADRTFPPAVVQALQRIVLSS